MSSIPSIGKWFDGIYADTPSVVVGLWLLKRRLRAIEQLLPLAAEQYEADPEYVHQLRVATRRAGAALAIFREFCDPRTYRKLRTVLGDIRRAAGGARQDDVHLGIFLAESERAGNSDDEAMQALIAAVRASREDAQAAIIAAGRRTALDRYRGLRRRLLKSLRTPDWTAGQALHAGAAEGAETADQAAPFTLAQLASQKLPTIVRSMREATADALEDLNALHALRIAGKKLRYALEVFAGCFPPDFKTSTYKRVEEMQERLGRINDLYEIVMRIEGVLRGVIADQMNGVVTSPMDFPGPRRLAECRDRYAEERDASHREFLEWWAAPGRDRLFDELDRLVAGLHTSADAQLELPSTAKSAVPQTPDNNGSSNGNGHRRVAAIDIGTNSLRLVVAESDPTTRFRIIDDVRETTRLGGGLYSTGHLDPAAVELSLTTLEKMRGIVDGYGVERLRAVGTCAVREASNGQEFVELVERRTGMHVEVIEADYEARLAFSSVVNAFDVDHLRFAAVDLGGGSTEIIISNGGLIDDVVKLPIGAVRLTEMYADPDNPGMHRVDKMRAAIERLVRENVALPTQPLDVIIGTGGTFTTLAKISIRRGAGSNREGRLPFALRGYEIPRSEITQTLEWLNSLTLDQRRKVPGMGWRRAEIMVAGMCIIDVLMQHLSIDRVRIHDGGIRDGLIAEMFDEIGVGPLRSPEAARAALNAVRSFADRSQYEKIHSEHVARLAIRIFDQLAVQFPDAVATWARPEARDILQWAAILHDVGILIDYRKHHRHSYDMISHARLAPLSRREIELVANVARYHRRGGPKLRDENFARLGDDDQRLVMHLAAILRIADGLDRLHARDVVDVVVHATPRSIRFDVRAEEAPRENIRYARRKADVFEAAFHTSVLIEWEPTTARRVMQGALR